MTCPNCGHTLTCGCQRKVASNGKQCCSTCVANVEAAIKANSKKDDQVLTPEQKARLQR